MWGRRRKRVHLIFFNPCFIEKIRTNVLLKKWFRYYQPSYIWFNFLCSLILLQVCVLIGYYVCVCFCVCLFVVLFVWSLCAQAFLLFPGWFGLPRKTSSASGRSSRRVSGRSASGGECDAGSCHCCCSCIHFYHTTGYTSCFTACFTSCYATGITTRSTGNIWQIYSYLFRGAR